MNGNASRLQAVESITNRGPATVDQTESLDDIWAVDVFNLEKMEKVLSKNAFENIKSTIQTNDALDAETAETLSGIAADLAQLEQLTAHASAARARVEGI